MEIQPIYVEVESLENKPAVAVKHHLQVNEADSQEAIKKAVQNPVQTMLAKPPGDSSTALAKGVHAKRN